MGTMTDERVESGTVIPSAPLVGEPAPAPRTLRPKAVGADRIFRGIIRLSGIAVLVIMGAVGLFLTFRAWQALSVAGLTFLTTQGWNPDAGRGGFGIAAVLVGTVLIGLTAIVIAVPLATGTALYISEYAPRRIQRGLVSLVDLMAAVPSVVYGLWGFFFLQGQITGLSRWIATWFGWIPIFSVDVPVADDPLPRFLDDVQAARLATEARAAEDQAAREMALKAEQAERDASIVEQAEREVASAAERKAARDARYAARKARK